MVGSLAGVVQSDHAFADTTKALTSGGTVGFVRPEDMVQFDIHGMSGWYIRARLSRGNFGGAPAQPPLVESLFVQFEEQPRRWAQYVAENFLRYENLTDRAEAGEILEPFVVNADEFPALYLALSSRPANSSPQRIYWQLAESREEAESSARISWDYWNGESWAPLKVTDDTRSLSRRGGVEFLALPDWDKLSLFNSEGFWLRLRWELGEYAACPAALGVYLNAVEVVQRLAIKGEVLGSSTHRPKQTFSLSQTPLLPGVMISVKEQKGGQQEWVKWEAVDSLVGSKSSDRHFLVDLHNGQIAFGDGIHGAIPPQGRDNIRADSYYVGGGVRGNVPAGSICVLETAFPDAVRNIERAVGGADAETIEEAKLRGPASLKHRFRAVTREDFEHLAREASQEVALAKCFTRGSEIMVIVLPKGERAKLHPDYRLLRKVKAFLDERRLITTRLRVAGPVYEDVALEVFVVITPLNIERFPKIRRDMEVTLQEFVHPLEGGSEGKGWPMGRSLHLSEIYYLLEGIAGIDYVDKVHMRRRDADRPTDKVKISERAFPYFQRITIYQV